MKNGVLSRTFSNKALVDSNEQIDPLKLERLNKFFENNKTLEEKQKTFWEILKKEKLNLKEFQTLFNNHLFQEQRTVEQNGVKQ